MGFSLKVFISDYIAGEVVGGYLSVTFGDSSPNIGEPRLSCLSLVRIRLAL